MPHFAFKTFFLSVEKMVEAFSLFSHLRNNLWKVIAVQIATPIYQEHFDYQVLTISSVSLPLHHYYYVWIAGCWTGSYTPPLVPGQYCGAKQRTARIHLHINARRGCAGVWDGDCRFYPGDSWSSCSAFTWFWEGRKLIISLFSFYSILFSKT